MLRFFLAIVLVCGLAVCVECAGEQSKQKKPIIWIHIGPPKTASTHLQVFGRKYTNAFKAAKIDWISGMDPQAPYTKHILLGKETEKAGHDKFLADIREKSRKNGNDMFLSFEGFSAFGIAPFQRLKADFFDYDIRIIHIFRDPMSHMLSFYNQMNKGWGPRHTTRSLGSDLLGMMTSSQVVRLPFSDPTVLEKCVQVFGRDNINIVDMEGSALTGHDISYTVYCEVMGVLCDKPNFFNNTEIGKNAREDLTILHLHSFFVGYLSNLKAGDAERTSNRYLLTDSSPPGRGAKENGVQRHMPPNHHDTAVGCRYCGQDYKKCAKWFDDWYKRKLLARDPIKYKIPTTTANLSMLIPYMDNMVSEVFNKYGDRILHGDKPAMLASIRKHSLVETLDIEEFFYRRPWLKIFEEAFEDGKNVPGLLCDC